MDFSQLLAQESDTIMERWLAYVRVDRCIESDDDMSDTAVRNSLPDVLKAMVTVLSQAEESDTQTLVGKSLVHGSLRASQGFDPAEIAQEYRLLRKAIFSVLDGNLLKGTVEEVLRAACLINEVVDVAISFCFQSYVEERLRELEQLHSQLSLINQELARLVRANQDNLSTLAHEMKTPLTSIIGYADLFLRDGRQRAVPADNMNHIEHIERVVRNGHQLLRLINDALEFARSEAGELKVQLAPTDVRHVIQVVVETVRPLALVGGLEMTVDTEAAPEAVVSDPFRLQQVLTNLMSNAIRYTRAGSVHLSCRREGSEHWSVAVRDTGIGIAPEHQTQVFNPYSRFACDERSTTDSTGLGLAIVAQLVELLQGEIRLVSEVGVGSTFTVIFPVQVDASTAQLATVQK